MLTFLWAHANDVIRPLLYGHNSNTLDNFYSSLSDERKICLKRDVPSYPKVKLMLEWYSYACLCIYFVACFSSHTPRHRYPSYKASLKMQSTVFNLMNTNVHCILISYVFFDKSYIWNECHFFHSDHSLKPLHEKRCRFIRIIDNLMEKRHKQINKKRKLLLDVASLLSFMSWALVLEALCNTAFIRL